MRKPGWLNPNWRWPGRGFPVAKAAPDEQLMVKVSRRRAVADEHLTIAMASMNEARTQVTQGIPENGWRTAGNDALGSSVAQA